MKEYLYLSYKVTPSELQDYYGNKVIEIINNMQKSHTPAHAFECIVCHFRTINQYISRRLIFSLAPSERIPSFLPVFMHLLHALFIGYLRFKCHLSQSDNNCPIKVSFHGIVLPFETVLLYKRQFIL